MRWGLPASLSFLGTTEPSPPHYFLGSSFEPVVSLGGSGLLGSTVGSFFGGSGLATPGAGLVVAGGFGWGGGVLGLATHESQAETDHDDREQ